jgi:hypothetical protein
MAQSRGSKSLLKVVAQVKILPPAQVTTDCEKLLQYERFNTVSRYLSVWQDEPVKM